MTFGVISLAHTLQKVISEFNFMIESKHIKPQNSLNGYESKELRF